MENLPAPQMMPRSELTLVIPWLPPVIIGVAIVLASAIGSYAFYAVRSFDNVLTVTGSAKQHVTSDTVKWRLNVVRKVTESSMQGGYPLLAKDIDSVKTFLKSHSVADDAVTVSQVYVEEQYKYGSDQSGPREFNLRQEIVIESKDVAAIDALSKNLSEVVAKGIFIQGNYLEFYVSNLPDLRVSLLGAAVTDAKARAVEIAKAGGKSVGGLKSASSGVVQVLAPNSIEITDYGSYDTQSIEKDVMVTARATFFVR